MKVVPVILINIIFLTSAFAMVGDEVLIKGKIHNAFDDKEVKILDSYGQIFFIPRSAFKKDFVMKQGNPFTIELNSEMFKQVRPEIAKKTDIKRFPANKK